MVDTIKYAFVGGEIAPTLFGRSDLEKYDLAVAEARNWFVDYSGGLSTRSGDQFIDFVMTPDEETKLLPFRFGPETAQTYGLLFGHHYIRFIQDGDYVLEAAKTITGISYSAGDAVVTTSGAHGYSVGDWVRLDGITGLTSFFEGRTFRVSAVPSGTTFKITDPRTGAAPGIFPATAVTGNAKRLYTVASTYNGDDLATLRAHQSRSVVYLTHNNYAVKKLTRVAHTNWTLSDETFGSSLSRPGTPALTVAAGTAGVGFVVTAVDTEGNESEPSFMGLTSLTIDYSQTAGQAKITWAGVSGAVSYNIYRTNIVTTGADINAGMQLGFIGSSPVPQFVDNNITPDFTIAPPQHYNPFDAGAVEYIQVTGGGAGYTSASAVSITTGTGSGFVGQAVVNSAGNLIGIKIINRGKGYISADTVNVTVGAGATFSKTLSPSGDLEPRVSATFQQRKVYAGSDANPLTINASKPADYPNFDYSDITQQDDSYEFELDAEDVAPIKHLLPTRSGLVIMSDGGVWQLSGGSERAVTPTNALADPQSFIGVSDVKPLAIDTDVLYIESKGGAVRLLTYNDFSKLFASQDISILSNHLTKPPRELLDWSYASDPSKTVYAVRDDGTLLCLTIVKEQNVYGWTHFTTRGLYKNVLTLQEGNVDTVYKIVERNLGGYTVKTLEKEVRRVFEYVEDAFTLDCALAMNYTYGAGSITPSAATGEAITLVASGATPFSSGSVGKIVRVGGGKLVITAYTDSTHVTARVLRPITDTLPETEDEPRTYSLWAIDTPVSAVSGLWHLEGMEVYGLLDGDVYGPVTVTNGEADFGTDVTFTRAIIGLKYDCVVRTLPPTVSNAAIEARLKRTVEVFVRVNASRGLQVGAALGNLYPVNERLASELATEPTQLKSGLQRTSIQSSFDFEGQFYIVQENSLPSTILSLIPNLEIPNAQR